MMSIDFAALFPALNFALALLAMACNIYLFLQRRGAATQSAIDRVESNAARKINDIENRLIRMESDVRHFLTRDDLSRDLAPLYEIARKTESTVSALSADIRAVAETQNTLNRLILQRGIEK